jgi:hypothetical protein
MERRSFLRTTVTTAVALWLVGFVEDLAAKLSQPFERL